MKLIIAVVVAIMVIFPSSWMYGGTFLASIALRSLSDLKAEA